MSVMNNPWTSRISTSKTAGARTPSHLRRITSRTTGNAAIGIRRGRSLDQQGDEERWKVEWACTRRRRVRPCDRAMQALEVGRHDKSGGEGQARMDLNSGFSRSGLVRGLALIAAAAVRDSRGLAAIVLLRGANRVNLTREYRQADRADDSRDEEHGRQFRVGGLHGTKRQSRDRANPRGRQMRIFRGTRLSRVRSVGGLFGGVAGFSAAPGRHRRRSGSDMATIDLAVVTKLLAITLRA